MKNYLYIDHFRGFTDTLIPIEDVNFFVGENSTGKTSILSLVSLLSSQEFWFNGQFRDKNCDFSFFGDIHEGDYSALDARSKAAILYTDTDVREKKFRALSLELISRKGKTTIASLKYISDKNELRIVINQDEILYSINSIAKLDSSGFEQWAKEGVASTAGFNKREYSIDNAMLSAPFFLINLISSDARKAFTFRDFPGLLEAQTWIAPIRAKPQKTYDDSSYDFSGEGTHTPYLLREIMANGKSRKTGISILQAIKKFGKDSNLFDNLEIKEFDKNSNSPFSLNIVLYKDKHQITNVGYGVSQVLPIIIEILRIGGRHGYIIQQPEVHLHPRAQASLGDLIFEASIKEGKKFIIETHSDFIINRLRQRMSQNHNNEGLGVQVIFFEREPSGNKAYVIPIENDGKYSNKQPDGFKNFFLEEELKNLSV